MIRLPKNKPKIRGGLIEKLFEPMFEGAEEYKTLIAEAEKRLAVMDNCDSGPVLNEEWMPTILTALSEGYTGRI